MIETRQITYVTNNSDKLYISREACVSLQMITDTFPTMSDINGNQTIHTLNDLSIWKPTYNYAASLKHNVELVTFTFSL